MRERAATTRCLTCGDPPPIPRLPTHVTPDSMRQACGRSRLPVGFAKEDAEPCMVEIGRGSHFLVLGNDPASVSSYVRAVYECMHGLGCLFVDTSGTLGPNIVDDSVLTSVEQAAALVRRIAGGNEEAPLVVFCGIVDLLDELENEDALLLASCITGESRRQCPGFVFVAEYWQVSACYDEWFRVVSGQGTGLWVGTGFADQSVFPLARVLSAYRAPAEGTDAFLVAHGNVRSVRLVEPEGTCAP